MKNETCGCDAETYCFACLEEMAALADQRAEQDALAAAGQLFDCGCDIEREFCDTCAMPDPRTVTPDDLAGARQRERNAAEAGEAFWHDLNTAYQAGE
ncbi:MAG: hypothetical protein KAJ19_27000 [Gammaproteobacteria bacterium]|nr:hypothetical protein [Gammaproteobacteria bacterium]